MSTLFSIFTKLLKSWLVQALFQWFQEEILLFWGSMWVPSCPLWYLTGYSIGTILLQIGIQVLHYSSGGCARCIPRSAASASMQRISSSESATSPQRSASGAPSSGRNCSTRQAAVSIAGSVAGAAQHIKHKSHLHKMRLQLIAIVTQWQLFKHLTPASSFVAVQDHSNIPSRGGRLPSGVVYLEKPADSARAHTAYSSEMARRTASATFGPASGARFPTIACGCKGCKMILLRTCPLAPARLGPLRAPLVSNDCRC